MKGNKNLKAFQALTDACMDKKDTFFGVYFASNDKEGITQFVGDPKLFGSSLAHILTRACGEEATEQDLALGNAILNALAYVLSQRIKSANVLLKAITNVLDRVLKERITKATNEGAEAPEDFDPKSETCLACDEYEDCLKRWVRKNTKKAGTKKRKGNKKNQGDKK
jgi:hypothetical protein